MPMIDATNPLIKDAIARRQNGDVPMQGQGMGAAPGPTNMAPPAAGMATPPESQPNPGVPPAGEPNPAIAGTQQAVAEGQSQLAPETRQAVGVAIQKLLKLIV